MLTKRAWEVLRQMQAAEMTGDHDDAEIVCEGNWQPTINLTKSIQMW
jgi:hypothetical protein